MSEDNKTTQNGAEPVQGGAQSGATEQGPEVAPKPSHADDLIAQLRRDLSDYKDRNLRLLADMENLRRRTDEEKVSAAKYGVQKFAGDVVNLVDNFQRAISAVPAGAAEENATLKSLVDGVAMTEREFLNVLERHGVKRIVSLGEVFSPHFHQPMMQIPNPEVPSGTILQVLQEGYMIGDRVLRAAVVTVSTGGPKPGAETQASAADAGGGGADQASSDGGSGGSADGGGGDGGAGGSD